VSSGTSGILATIGCPGIANCADGALTCVNSSTSTCSACLAGYTLSGSACTDTTAPAAVTNIVTIRDYADLTLAWDVVTDANGSGLKGYRVAFGVGPTAPACSDQNPLLTEPTVAIDGLSNATSYAYRICAEDRAGNRSSVTGLVSTLTCNAVAHCTAGAVTCTTATDSTCTSCEAGYRNDGGICVACAAGTYAASAATQCTACAYGTYSAAGAGSCTAWRWCAAGNGFAVGTSTTDATCTACTGATYSTGGQMACTAWQTCSAGYGYAAGSASANATCTDCTNVTVDGVGTWSAGGQMACTARTQCSAGTYASQTPTISRDRICTPCAPGTYTSAGNLTSCTAWTVTSCPAGQGYTQGTSTSNGSCTACNSGAEAGKYSLGGTGPCIPWTTTSCSTGFAFTAGTASADGRCTNTAPTLTTTANRMDIVSGTWDTINSKWRMRASVLNYVV
jgi:syndecan 4